MILDQQKYYGSTYVEDLAPIIARHKIPMVISLILVAVSVLFFYLSGSFLPLALGTLFSSLLLLIAPGRLMIHQIGHASTRRDAIADMPTQEISRLTLPSASIIQTHTIPVALRQGLHGAEGDPDATLIATRTPPLVEGPRHLQASSRSDPGIARRNLPNEDTTLALVRSYKNAQPTLPTGLFVVADGMGGHANGKLASQLAIQSISAAVEPLLTQPIEEPMYEEHLKQGIRQANLAIYQRNNESTSQANNGGRHMMGSTMTAALIIDTTAYIVNVGDSRTYRYRPSVGLQKITNDHSIVASMVSAGIIEPDEIYTHPKRNQIYRCLGEKSDVEVDSFTVDLQENDLLLLCSDGLWEMVRDAEIEHILQVSSAQPDHTSAALIQAALRNGGADNVSVVLARLAGKAQAETSEESATLIYQRCA